MGWSVAPRLVCSPTGWSAAPWVGPQPHGLVRSPAAAPAVALGARRWPWVPGGGPGCPVVAKLAVLICVLQKGWKPSPRQGAVFVLYVSYEYWLSSVIEACSICGFLLT